MKARALVVAGLVAAAPSLSSLARADEPKVALDAPAPPTLPALAHRGLVYTLEYTAAGIDPGHGAGRAYAWFLHNDLEYPLIPRTLYVGAAHDVVAGAVPGQGDEFFFGAPEIWTRALWSSGFGLSSGGGFGVVLPAPRSLTTQERTIFETVRVVRPWDEAYFTDRVVTLRPWVDVRHVWGPFILQFRQGLDVAIVARSLLKDERRVDYAARATFYTGYRLTPAVGLGLEVWEVYQITADLADDKRAAVAISPSVRLSLGRVEPAFSLVFPLTTPLRGDASFYYAARLNVGFEFDVPTLRGRER